MELAGSGELFERIISERTLSENIARYVMRQLVDVVMCSHGNKIVHADLKVILYVYFFEIFIDDKL